jgi:glycosyltransferase involved in cell wall biosynthesis/peptidoglycan/xylan/chitin deacetylase (PgdA/CDA1 family)
VTENQAASVSPQKSPGPTASSPAAALQERIRVLQVNYHHTFGGSERLAATIGTALDPKRFDARFAAMKGDGEVGEMLRARGFPTTVFGRREGFDPAALWRVWTYLRNNPVDVVQTHHVGSLVYCALPARLLGVKVVHTEHDVHSFQRFPHELRWLRWLGWTPHRYIAIDPTIAEFLHAEGGVASDRIHVIRNGIDLSKFHPREPDRGPGTDKPFIVGWVSRLSSPKRPDVLIDAMALLAAEDPQIRACVIGSGDLLPLMQARAEAAGVADRVEFLGARDDIAEQLRRFDCYVLCSEMEGLPISLVEAMATELPCIVSGVGGVPKLLSEGRNGLILPDLKPESLAERIGRLRRDPEAARRIGRCAGELARESFDLSNTIEQYQEVFESVLAAPAAIRTRRLTRPLKSAAFRSLARLNSDKWVVRSRTDALVVVGYHGLAPHAWTGVKSWLLLPEEEFDRQLQYLAENFEVVAMSEAARRLAEGRPFERPTACITFDDGYKNNFTLAAPILCRRGLPATFYLATGFIGTDEILWMPRLEHALASTRRPRLNLSDYGLGVYSLGRGAAESFVRLLSTLYRMPRRRRNRILAAVVERLDPNPNADLSCFEMMSWNDVAAMESMGLFEFGGHTVSHQIVRPLDDEELEMEIGRSIREVAAHVRRPPTTFAYPNGTQDDFDERAKEVLRRHGVEAAVSTIEGVNSSKSDRYALRRVLVGSMMGMDEFRVRVSGLVDWVKRRGRG